MLIPSGRWSRWSQEALLPARPPAWGRAGGLAIQLLLLFRELAAEHEGGGLLLIVIAKRHTLSQFIELITYT